MFEVLGIHPVQQSFGGDVRVRGEESPPEVKQGRYDTTSRGSATKSTSTRARAKRDASLEVEATLRDRKPHDHLLKEIRRDITGSKSARE